MISSYEKEKLKLDIYIQILSGNKKMSGRCILFYQSWTLEITSVKEKYNSEISFKLFETIVDLNAFQRKEKKKWNCFFRRGLQFLMHVERFWGHDVWVWLTLTNHDESILFWHLCQRWNQKTILKFQSLTNGGNIFQISYIQEVTSIFTYLKISLL